MKKVFGRADLVASNGGTAATVVGIGPGDPSAVDYAIKTIKQLVEYNRTTRPLPIFGIFKVFQFL